MSTNTIQALETWEPRPPPLPQKKLVVGQIYIGNKNQSDVTNKENTWIKDTTLALPCLPNTSRKDKPMFSVRKHIGAWIKDTTLALPCLPNTKPERQRGPHRGKRPRKSKDKPMFWVRKHIHHLRCHVYPTPKQNASEYLISTESSSFGNRLYWQCCMFSDL